MSSWSTSHTTKRLSYSRGEEAIIFFWEVCVALGGGRGASIMVSRGQQGILGGKLANNYECPFEALSAVEEHPNSAGGLVDAD
jgi:hypothetical protein